MNIDDDDDDGGGWGHGDTQVISDRWDSNEVVGGDNDLVQLKLNKLDVNAGDDIWEYKLFYPDTNIRVWLSNEKHYTEEVWSGMEFDATEDTYLWVEGISPSELKDGTMLPETVTLKAYCKGKYVGEDTIKIRVAEMMFAVFAHAPKNSNMEAIEEKNFRRYLNNETNPFGWSIRGIEAEKRENNLFVVDKGDRCFSVRLCYTQKEAKIALQAEDSYVAFDAHSNYGLGYVFAQDAPAEDIGNVKHIDEFMNIGESFAAIDWNDMRTVETGGTISGHGLTGFWIRRSEYADDPLTVEPRTRAPNYDVWVYTATIKGTSGPYEVKHFTDNPMAAPAAGRVAGHHVATIPYPNLNPNLQEDPRQLFDRHYETVSARNQYRRYVVAQAGSADVPALRYKMLYLHSCTSGPHFYNQFQQGTLFYLTTNGNPGVQVTAFFDAILDGEDEDGILKYLKYYPGPEEKGGFDYHTFP